jgi:hypothetical protein
MNQQQLQAAHYKQQLMHANAKIAELAEALQDKQMIDRLMIAALTGACARDGFSPDEAVEFAFQVGESMAKKFTALKSETSQDESVPASESGQG